MTRWAFAVATAVVLVLLPAPGFAASKPTPPASPRTPKRIQSDFNHDGYEDLAISIFTEDVSGVVDAGAVEVLYGGPTGLSANGNQLWTAADVPCSGGLQYQAMFGRSMGAGDLNGDGYTDLVIGIMHENLTVGADAGEVDVLYGSASGLTTTGVQCWTENDLTSSIGAHKQSLFGRSLDVGDFNGDGWNDLAIGIPYQSFSQLTTNAGAVGILFGSAAGLTATGNEYFTQDTPGMPGDGSAKFLRTGWSVSAGDYNGDGFDDLAIGTPGDAVGSVAQAGTATVLYGTSQGLTTAGAQLWSEDLLTNCPAPGAGDWFGRNVRAADFNADGYADLVFAIPSEDVDGFKNAGAVGVVYGSPSGLNATAGPGNQCWNEDSPGLLGNSAAPQDHFGRHEGMGDFNADGYDDLAVGIVSKDVNGKTDAGAVVVIYGTADGLATPGNQYWTLDSPFVKGQASTFGAMGRAVSGLDFNGDGFDDLAVGVPGDTVTGLLAAGSVLVLNGSAAGLTAVGNQRWTGTSPGILAGVQAGALFGAGFPGQTAGGCGRGGTCTD